VSDQGSRNSTSIENYSCEKVLFDSRKFLYLFGYEDEVRHDVEMVDVIYKNIKAKYPSDVKKQGKSPG
jgi:hypothetical protein